MFILVESYFCRLGVGGIGEASPRSDIEPEQRVQRTGQLYKENLLSHTIIYIARSNEFFKQNGSSNISREVSFVSYKIFIDKMSYAYILTC